MHYVLYCLRKLLKIKIATKMKNKKISKKTGCVFKSPLLAVFLVVAVLGLKAVSIPLVSADRFDEQIKALNAENSVKAQNKAQLGTEAVSLADAIAKLQGQIATLQNQIAANQAKSEDLRKQIVAAEEELAKQRRVLGESIKVMYLEGDISTIEMLASSKDLSEFVDKQQYRDTVQAKIKGMVDKITALKLELKGQRETLEKQIEDQRYMEDQLATQRAEQDKLLGLNQSQQAELNNQIKQNSAQISELKRQQAAENARLFTNGVPKGIPGGGGYPGAWANAPIDSIVDTWGMYNRECVSFTAWKVWNSGRYMPYWGGIGNANQWDDNARAAGIPVDTSPRPGDVAISNRGVYGHAMYVEHVYNDGTIYVSQYNAGLDGYYSEARINAAGLYFIHF